MTHFFYLELLVIVRNSDNKGIVRRLQLVKCFPNSSTGHQKLFARYCNCVPIETKVIYVVLLDFGFRENLFETYLPSIKASSFLDQLHNE